MDDSNSPKEFGNVAKTFHWIIFFLFLFQFGIALVMYGVATDEYYPKELFMIHKSVGALAFFIAIARLMWRKLTPLPSWPSSMTDFEKKAFHYLEIGLYAVMIMMPLSGYMYSLGAGYGFKFFGLFEFPDLIGKNAMISLFGKYLHRVLAFLTVGLIAAHFALILRHHCDEKDNFIDRMSFFKTKKH